MDQKPNGHRKMTTGRLRAERLAKAFNGFGDLTSRQALRVVRDYATATLASSPLRLYLFMLKTCERSLLFCPEELDFTSCVSKLCFFAKNDLITTKTGLQTKTIQRAIRTLEEEGFIWCNDNGSRNRTPSNGICLLPAFSRLHEMKEQLDCDMLDLAIARQQRRQISAAKAEILSLRDAIQLDENLMSVDISVLDELVDLADATLRINSGVNFMDALLVLTKSLTELKSLFVVYSEGQMSPYPDKNVAPLTYKILLLKKDVESLRIMELSPQSELELSPQVIAEPMEAIITPKPEHVIRGIKALMANKMFPKVDQADMPDEAFIRKCGTVAAMEIAINPRATAMLHEKFGNTDAASLLIHAAADPKIRHRGAWAAHFAYEDFESPINIGRSFFRMVKDIDRQVSK